jgi:coenzyme PQQ precursor peptide PqqA
LPRRRDAFSRTLTPNPPDPMKTWSQPTITEHAASMEVTAYFSATLKK